MSPSSSFVAVDIIKDNIIFIVRAEFGVQVAVVVNGHEWDTDKQVKLQTCQPDDACLTVDSYRCKGCRKQGWELVQMDPSHTTSENKLLIWKTSKFAK
jgi:hypothetical protein